MDVDMKNQYRTRRPSNDACVLMTAGFSDAMLLMVRLAIAVAVASSVPAGGGWLVIVCHGVSRSYFLPQIQQRRLVEKD